MAKKKIEPIEEIVNENISIEPLEEVMGDRYATYAKYVIQDRAIPDVRDGLKPVQRRIIFSMYKSNNTFNRPTKKCAHTVGAVMGTFHPHGDTSIYEALARMSQDWKLRYPLIDFQGNNGSIDGDSPAAYRYTESRLAEISNELIRDIEKQTVDMQLNFDDTELEPVVLPARFPNLYLNGTEGIAVALATEIPPHNLRELINATIYRINHRTSATVQDLMEFVQGPDFPGGGIIYKSQGLENIYLEGRGRIEVASKAEILSQKDIQQIIITEIPYKVVKIQLVYEIDKIRHSKAIDGIIEVRDESDYQGIRIVVDIKKDAKAELILQYLMNKTSLCCGYSANIVAIVGGRPKTLTLLDYIDAYLDHQVDVITRKSQFELTKAKDRLHIVNGLLIATLNIDEVVKIIRSSNDKTDSKNNIMARFNLDSNQAEAIVVMPLYKLSHTDETILQKEKIQLENDVERLQGILDDPKKLDRVLIKDLKAISDQYGDDRRTQIIEKGETKEIDKRELIAKEDVMIAVTYDGYVKRSSIKSFRSSESLPGIKSGDMLIGISDANTIDYLICFTNQGNFISVPVHKLTETKWKDEGTHLNEYSTLSPGEKIIKCIVTNKLRDDLYLGFLTRLGQIKRMCLNSLDLFKHSRPVKCMNLLKDDRVVDIALLTGNSDLLVITNNGTCSLYNENNLTIIGAKAGGVKSIANIGKNYACSLLSFAPEEIGRIVLITNKAHERVTDINRINRTQRLGKTQNICPSFKSDIHEVIKAFKVGKNEESAKLNLYLNNHELVELPLIDLQLTEAQYAKKNINIPGKTLIAFVSDGNLIKIDDKIESFPPLEKEIVKSSEQQTLPLEEIEQDEQQTLSDSADYSNQDETINKEGKTLNSAFQANNKNEESKNESTENKGKEGKAEQMSLFDLLDD